MNLLNITISENILKLRQERKITQEELAAFLGITKASVSKWETSQSFPDITLLPQIAIYFDVTIDELIGYKPQLSTEQIRSIYKNLAKDFTKLPFHEVMDKSKKLVREYYSCYSFLLQIGVLWLNHFMLAAEEEGKLKILKDIYELCNHISNKSNDVGIASDARVLKAIVNLQMNKPNEAIAILEPINDPKRFSTHTDTMLTQAYQMIGDKGKAVSFNQIKIFSNLLSLVNNSMSYLYINMENKEIGEETIRRIAQVIKAYDLDNLNENAALQFHYQVTMFYSIHGEKEKALKELEIFVRGCLALVKDGISLHGDEYFTSLDEWFEELDLGVQPPRDIFMIIDNVKQALEHPALTLLFDTKEYKELKNLIHRKGE